jgi:ABC-type uncharacterized transport system auxiliary subunit
MRTLPLAACAATLAACAPAPTQNDSFAANVSDVEDIPASEGNEAAPDVVAPATNEAAKPLSGPGG